MSPTRDESQILMKIIMPERFRSFVAARGATRINLLRDLRTDKAYLGTPPSGYRFHLCNGWYEKDQYDCGTRRALRNLLLLVVQ